MKRLLSCAIALALVSTGLVTPAAAVPQNLSYQGVLTDGSGSVVPNGSYSVTFKLYDVDAGGTELWTETQNVLVTKGIFSAVLGSVQTLDLPFDVQYWLGISVSGGAELTPRTALTATAYSLNSRAVNGDQNIFPGAENVGIGTKTPGYPLHIVTDNYRCLWIDGLSGGSWASIVLNAQDSGSGAVMEYLREGNYVAHTLVDYTNSFKIDVGPINVFKAVPGTGYVGIGVANPLERLDVGGALHLGTTTVMNPGSIRWTGDDFEGCDGWSWKSFTATGAGLPSGSAGQTLRHDGSSWIANSNIYDDGTNVGIGTTSPQFKLHVNGLARFDLPSGQFNISTPGGWPGLIAYAPNGNRRDVVFNDAGLYITAGSSSSPPAGENGIILRETGDIIIGTASPSGTGKLEVYLPDPMPGRAAIAGISEWINPPSYGGGFGIYGSYSSDGVSGIGIYGEAINGSPAGNMVGVYGYTNDGYGVYSEGNLGMTGATTSIVGTRDYGWREVYAVSSAGNWFEDFGSGQLAGGEAAVTIDPVFAQTVSLADDYHVFLTPLGDCALYVAEKNEKGFIVKAVGGAATNVAFDYRIVAKRSGYEAKRLEAAESPAVMQQRLGVGAAAPAIQREATSKR